MRRVPPSSPAPIVEHQVPAWLTKPVLAIAIPHTGFGFGYQPEGTTEPQAVEPEPEMLGFVEDEPARPAPVAPPADAVSVPSSPPPVVVSEPVVEPEPLATVPEPAPLEPVAIEPEPAPQPPAVPPEPAIQSEPLATVLEPAPLEPVAIEPPPTRAPEPIVAAVATPKPAVVAQPEIAAETAPSHTNPAAEPAPPTAAPAPVAESPVMAQRAPRPLGAPQSPPRPAPAPPPDEVAAPGTDLVAAAAPVQAKAPATVEPDAEAGDALPGIPDEPGERSLARNRRLYRRVGIEAELDIDGARAQLVDLSMDGFAGTAQWQYQSEAEVPVAIRMSIDGVHIGTEMRARIVYAGETRTGGRFLSPTASQTALLRYLVTWRGKPAGALGTANLLDALAGLPERSPASSSPPPSPLLELPGRSPPWWQRLFARLLGRRRRERE